MITFKQFLDESAKTTAQAKAMGLTHMGFGRWGKNGVQTHKVYYGTLIEVEPKKQKPTTHQDVHEDEQIIVQYKALDMDQFQDVGKPRAEDPCIYNQVLHAASLKTGISPRELMKRFNPKGQNGYGITLDDAISGFEGHEKDGKKLKIDVVGAIDDVDAALDRVKNGDIVLAMVHSYGGIMASIGNKNSIHKELVKNNKEFVKNKGLVKARGKSMVNDDRNNFFHAVMLIGYDKKEKNLIFRDSQHDYARDGFFRVPIDDVRSGIAEVLKFVVLDPHLK